MLTALRHVRDVPRSIYARLVHMLVWHSTAWLELVLGWTTGLYGLVILRVIPPATRNLLGNVSVSSVALIMLLLSGFWILAVMWHGWPGGKKARVRLCQFATGVGFVLWMYLALDMYSVLGLRPIAALLITLYTCLAVGCSFCWVRCLFVLREWTMRTAPA